MDKYLKGFIGGLILVLFITAAGCFFDAEELNPGHNGGTPHPVDGFCTGFVIHSTIYREVGYLSLLFSILLPTLGGVLPGFTPPQIHPPNIS